MGQAHKGKALSDQSTNIDNVFKSKYLQMIDQFVKKTSSRSFLSPDVYSLRLVTYRDLLARPPDSFSSYDMCNKLDEVFGCQTGVATQSEY